MSTKKKEGNKTSRRGCFRVIRVGGRQTARESSSGVGPSRGR